MYKAECSPPYSVTNPGAGLDDMVSIYVAIEIVDACYEDLEIISPAGPFVSLDAY